LAEIGDPGGHGRGHARRVEVVADHVARDDDAGLRAIDGDGLGGGELAKAGIKVDAVPRLAIETGPGEGDRVSPGGGVGENDGVRQRLRRG